MIYNIIRNAPWMCNNQNGNANGKIISQNMKGPQLQEGNLLLENLWERKKVLFKNPFLTHPYIKLGQIQGGVYFQKISGICLIFSFIAFLCDNFEIFPNFGGSQRVTSPKGGGSVHFIPLPYHLDRRYSNSQILLWIVLLLLTTNEDQDFQLDTQRFQEGRSRRNILKICYEFSWSYWKSIFKSVKISRFSPKYSAISSFLSQVCCLVTPTESFVLKIFSKYFGGIALLYFIDDESRNIKS